MKKLLALLTILLFPLTSFAAISAGTGSGGKNAAGSPLSYSYTVNGPNAFLVVQVRGPTTDLCTSVTWNSITLTKMASNLNGRFDYTYGANVAPGTGNVVVTCAGTDLIISNADEYDGVAAGQILTATVATKTTSTTFSQSTTTIADNSWIVWNVVDGAGSLSAGANTTLRYAPAADPNVGILDSGGPVHPAGSLTLNASGGSSTWDGEMLILTPFLGGPPINFFQLF